MSKQKLGKAVLNDVTVSEYRHLQQYDVGLYVSGLSVLLLLLLLLLDAVWPAHQLSALSYVRQRQLFVTASERCPAQPPQPPLSRRRRANWFR